MSAPHEPALDVRHWELAEKLRSAPPRPSDELRERVRALAASEPTPARRRLVPSRRLVFALAPLALVLAGGAAVGLQSSAGDRDRTPPLSAFPKERPLPARGVDQGEALSALPSKTAARSRAATFAPDGTQVLVTYDDGSAWLYAIPGGGGSQVDWAGLVETSWQRLAIE